LLTGGVQPYSVSLYNSNKTLQIKADTITNDVVVKSITGADSLVVTLIPGTVPKVKVEWIGLPAGKYFIESKDINYGGNPNIIGFDGCSTLDSMVINQPLRLTPNVTVTNLLCFNDGKGFVDPNPTGGTPFSGSNPYTYKWSNGLTTPDLNNIQAGTYSVTITDKNNCKADTTVTVTQPPVITLSAARTNVNCRSQSTGSINLTVTGGTPKIVRTGVTAYTYAWTGPNNFTSTLEDPTGLAAGVYTVTVKDSFGILNSNQNPNCIATLSVTITEPASALSYTLSPTPVNCYGNATGSIQVTALTG
jgi:hypothetical protein